MNNVKKAFLALALLASTNSAFAGYFDWANNLKSSAKSALNYTTSAISNNSVKAFNFVNNNRKAFGVGALAAVASGAAYKYRKAISDFGKKKFAFAKCRYNNLTDSQKKVALAGTGLTAAIIGTAIAYRMIKKA